MLDCCSISSVVVNRSELVSLFPSTSTSVSIHVPVVPPGSPSNKPAESGRSGTIKTRNDYKGHHRRHHHCNNNNNNKVDVDVDDTQGNYQSTPGSSSCRHANPIKPSQTCCPIPKPHCIGSKLKLKKVRTGPKKNQTDADVDKPHRRVDPVPASLLHLKEAGG